jgi:RND family efflux transporter MFP subunit
MKRPVVMFGVAAVVVAALGARYLMGGSEAGAEPTAGAAGGRGGGGRGGRGLGARLPITVELGSVARGEMALHIEVVGNLIGLATVEATPKVSGRLESVSVHLGDRVNKGQVIAKVDDREVTEQVNQAQAAHEVSAATIRQREAAAVAQLDLARAQFSQAQSRLQELRINLSNTVITSPVSGFVGRRLLDPGAWVTPASAFVSVVDLSVVRLVANVVEKDIRLITAGLPAEVVVDAFPGEKFEGRVARVAPVLDPLTRTAQIEIEIPNPESRLKPGMYAKVSFVAERHENALVIPTVALVDTQGKRGVYVPEPVEGGGQTAHFQEVEVGWVQDDRVEVLSGIEEGARIVITGAAALREGDVMLLPGESAGAGGGRRGEAGRGTGGGGGRAGGGAGGGGGRGGGRRGGGTP